jgi:hypothetical protein
MHSFTAAILLTATAFLTSEFTVPAPAEPAQTQSVLREFILQAARRTRATESPTGAFDARYEFTHTRITEERNSRGELRRRDFEQTHHRPEAASPSSNPTARSTPPAPKSSDQSNEERDVSRDDFHVDSPMLERFVFAPLDEDFRGGRRQRVFDFTPASDHLPTHNFKDKYINQTSGRLWIDAEDLVLTRLQLHLRKPVNVWGGLLGVIWEFHFDLERERTTDGDWYTRNAQWHLRGRRLFVTKIIDFHEERTDVRRVR